ncbi:hypothetical protein VM95_26540 [Streptomyces rubellomurinus]|uniref:Uncharacterized protein n=2 Tax=Streptomyces rubellomurinus (strain ATCC 31215) TaxID=359131 RepID=A0A0F2T8K5_STRR3|nr:hypothetical protein VM95_26540 [Streptomyces rubellomurinus]
MQSIRQMRKSEPAVAEHARPTDIPLVTLRLIGTVTGMAIPIVFAVETGDPDDVFTLCDRGP